MEILYFIDGYGRLLLDLRFVVEYEAITCKWLFVHLSWYSQQFLRLACETL